MLDTVLDLSQLEEQLGRCVTDENCKRIKQHIGFLKTAFAASFHVAKPLPEFNTRC